MPDQPFVSELPKFHKLIERRGLVSLANNTKWDELINAIRSTPQNSWKPSYRCKCIDSDFVSEWDCEWWYHLPYPFICVQWLDLSFQEDISVGRRLPSKILDHSLQLEALLSRIGLDYEKGLDSIRIFGYAPRDLDDFNK